MRPHACASAAALLLLLALAALAPLAQAHALPIQTTPRSGSVVQAVPREAVISFSEALERSFSRLEVRGADGTVVSGPSTIDDDGATMRATLPRDLPYGPYSMSWRALSAVDGHTTRGLVPFLYPDPSKPLNLSDLPPQDAAGGEAVVTPLDVALRALSYIGLFAALGTAVLVVAILHPGALVATHRGEVQLARLAAAGALLAAVAGVLLAASYGAAAAQVGLAQALARPDVLGAGRFGALAMLRAPLLLLAAGAAWLGASRGAASRGGFAAWMACLALAGAALVTVSLSSHAAALPSPILGVANDAVHLLAGAAWIGAFAGLGWVRYAARREPPPRAGVAARFSGLATVAVAVVVLTGVLASALHLRALSDLWTSDYGRVLLVKLALVAGVVALGGRNKFRLVPEVRAAEGEARAQAVRRFGRAVRFEALLGAAVLVAAGALSAVSPPGPPPPLSQPPAAHELQAFGDGVNVSLLISPSPVQVGPSTFDLFLTLQGVSDANATGANLTLTPPDRALGDTTVPLQPAHVGHFAAEGTYFTLPGPWTVKASAQRSGAFDVVVQWTVDVAPAP